MKKEIDNGKYSKAFKEVYIILKSAGKEKQKELNEKYNPDNKI